MVISGLLQVVLGLEEFVVEVQEAGKDLRQLATQTEVLEIGDGGVKLTMGGLIMVNYLIEGDDDGLGGIGCDEVSEMVVLEVMKKEKGAADEVVLIYNIKLQPLQLDDIEGLNMGYTFGQIEIA